MSRIRAEASVGRAGKQHRAKTDKVDARALRELLEQHRVPDSWVPPHQVLEVRAKIRLYDDLLRDRIAWQQRIHATLFSHPGGAGVSVERSPSECLCGP